MHKACSIRKIALFALGAGLIIGLLALTGCTSTTASSGETANGPAASEEGDEEWGGVESVGIDDPINRFSAASAPIVLSYYDGPAGLADGQATTDMARTGNACYSPTSLYMALGMLGLGTDDEAGQQVLNALGFTDKAALADYCQGALNGMEKGFEDYTVEIADSVWIQDGMNFTPEYLAAVQEKLDGEAFSIDFGTEAADAEISDWVSEETNGLITPDIQTNSTQLAAVINAIYFKDGWLTPFNAAETTQGVFHGPEGDRQADFMHQLKDGGTYTVQEDFVAASLPFSGGGQMTFFLPSGDTSVYDLLATPESTNALLGIEMEPAAVTWSLPKFTIDSSYKDLASQMAKLGVKDIFDETKTGMFDSMIEGSTDGFFISELIQETHLALDEEGVEAAAYTAGIMATKAMPLEPVDFVLNRPFVYTITSPNNTVLFMGIVEDPAA